MFNLSYRTSHSRSKYSRYLNYKMVLVVMTWLCNIYHDICTSPSTRHPVLCIELCISLQWRFWAHNYMFRYPTNEALDSQWFCQHVCDIQRLIAKPRSVKSDIQLSNLILLYSHQLGRFEANLLWRFLKTILSPNSQKPTCVYRAPPKNTHPIVLSVWLRLGDSLVIV